MSNKNKIIFFNPLSVEEYKGEINNLPSLTIPDETMDMRTMLDRYAKGLPIGGGLNSYYDEEDDLPDIRTLDLAERQQYAEMFKQELEQIRSKESNTLANKGDEIPEVVEVTQPGTGE